MIPKHLYLASFPTGSNYICNPPVTNTDIDEMFLVSDMEKTYNELIEKGWKYNSKDSYPVGTWASYRMGVQNALCTDNIQYFNKFLAATEEAKKLNLLDKKDRIALFAKYMGEKKEAKYTQVTYGFGDGLTVDPAAPTAFAAMPPPEPFVMTAAERVEHERMMEIIREMQEAQEARRQGAVNPN